MPTYRGATMKESVEDYKNVYLALFDESCEVANAARVVDATDIAANCFRTCAWASGGIVLNSSKTLAVRSSNVDPLASKASPNCWTRSQKWLDRDIASPLLSVKTHRQVRLLSIGWESWATPADAPPDVG